MSNSSIVSYHMWGRKRWREWLENGDRWCITEISQLWGTSPCVRTSL